MADDSTKVTLSSGFTQAANDSADNPWGEVQKEVNERFELLPEEVQKIISGDAYKQSLFEIAKAQKLTYDEMGVLEVETTMVLLGMNRPDGYRDELQLQLKKNDEEIDTIVGLINDQVFVPIRAALEKIYANQKASEDYIAGAPTTVGTTPDTGTKIELTTASSAQPGKSVPLSIPSLSTQEKTLLEKTGVIISDTPTVSTRVPAPIPNRDSLLQGIENPVKTSFTGMVADKLKTSAPVMPATKTTDYTIAKTPPASTPSSASPRTSDPYREPLS